MSLASDLLVRVPVEYFEALRHLLFIAVRGAVAHVVHYLIPHCGIFVSREFEGACPELLEVLAHSAGTHLLSGPLPDEGVFTPAQLNQLLHVFSGCDSFQVITLL